MKNFEFVIDKVHGTNGTCEVGTWDAGEIEISIDAQNIDSAEKKFNKIYPKILKEEGWTYTGIIYSTYIRDADTGERKYLQTFGTK
jgi:hypothetical protein